MQQLTEKRESCLRNLLQNQSCNLNTISDFELDESVKSDLGAAQEILRHLKPEQPLSIGEIVHILEHDHLSIEKEEIEKEIEAENLKINENESN